MLKKKTFWMIVCALALAVMLGGASVLGSQPKRPVFPHSTVVITRADGQKFTYRVEVARNESEQAYGLMYLDHMPDDAGMIFPYDTPRDVAFWMKNTRISLDMLFIDADHHIGRLSTYARPMDMTPIVSGMPVSSVIELNAGQVDQNKFAVGDRVDYAGLINP